MFIFPSFSAISPEEQSISRTHSSYEMSDFVNSTDQPRPVPRNRSEDNLANPTSERTPQAKPRPSRTPSEEKVSPNNSLISCHNGCITSQNSHDEHPPTPPSVSEEPSKVPGNLPPQVPVRSAGHAPYDYLPACPPPSEPPPGLPPTVTPPGMPPPGPIPVFQPPVPRPRKDLTSRQSIADQPPLIPFRPNVDHTLNGAKPPIPKRVGGPHPNIPPRGMADVPPPIPPRNN